VEPLASARFARAAALAGKLDRAHLGHAAAVERAAAQPSHPGSRRRNRNLRSVPRSSPAKPKSSPIPSAQPCPTLLTAITVLYFWRLARMMRWLRWSFALCPLPYALLHVGDRHRIPPPCSRADEGGAAVLRRPGRRAKASAIVGESGSRQERRGVGARALAGQAAHRHRGALNCDCALATRSWSCASGSCARCAARRSRMCSRSPQPSLNPVLTVRTQMAESAAGLHRPDVQDARRRDHRRGWTRWASPSPAKRLRADAARTQRRHAAARHDRHGALHAAQARSSPTTYHRARCRPSKNKSSTCWRNCRRDLGMSIILITPQLRHHPRASRTSVAVMFRGQHRRISTRQRRADEPPARLHQGPA